jgi:hypothetical protein
MLFDLIINRVVRYGHAGEGSNRKGNRGGRNEKVVRLFAASK